MPPRRGRAARGSGESSGPAAPPPAPAQDQPSENEPSGPSSMAHRDKSNTTPENTQNEVEFMDIDPNDSPATQPTETPASTPIRPPPAPQMQPAAGPSGTASRGGSRGRGSLSKFKPKNIRRSASELKAFADAEDKRAAAAAAIAGRSRGRGYASRGRAGRGRGDAMGRGRATVGGSVASGPFAVAPEIGKKGGLLVPGSIKRESGPSTSRTSGASRPNVKSEGHAPRTGHGGTSYHSDPQYPDEDESVPRIDIQNINLVSSDEDDESLSPTPGYKKGKSLVTSSKGGLKPVRLDRHEHKDRTSQVNTGPTVKDMPAENTRDSDTPMVDEERSTRVNRGARQKGVQAVGTDGNVQVKDEPDEPVNLMDQVEPGPQASSSAAHPKPRHYEIDTESDEAADDEPARKEKRATRAKKKSTTFVIQTEEDRNEWERHLEDLEVLKEELGGMQHHSIGKGKAREDDAEGEKPTDKKEGRLYLFQFPPAMPKLVNPATLPKRDPGIPAEQSDNDFQVTGSRDNNVMDLDKTIKPEEEEIIKKEDDEPLHKTTESLATEEGYVGKLIVRESGRVELDWGGSRMLVSRGIETSFLSMGVLVDSKGCFDNEGKPTQEGLATGMGKIMGKFVVTPDWESMVEDIERAERRERHERRK